MKDAAAAITVRDARLSDLDFLVQAAMEVARESEGLVLDAVKARAGTRAVVEDRAKGRFFVAEMAGRAVASLFVSYEWSDWNNVQYWWIQTAYSVPELRGKGCYKALYHGVLGVAKREGIGMVRLYVESHNTSGLRAYRGLGMTQTPYLVFEQRP